MPWKILVIATGGTIGMLPSPHGFVPAFGLAERLRQGLPELFGPAMPKIEFLEYPEPLDSANMSPADWYRIARDISARCASVDGFLVLHGTDSMAFTASALSFLLAPATKPVVLTGSQLPFGSEGSDAPGNLLGAVRALSRDLPGAVYIYFNQRLFPGNRVTKARSAGPDAFDAPRGLAVAKIASGMLPSTDAARVLSAHHEHVANHQSRVAILRLFPGISGATIDALVSTGIKGLVLECYGTGNGPDRNGEFLAALERARESGVIVVAVSQCHHGRVDFSRYVAGGALSAAGVVSGNDMTVEAAFAKLQVLLDRGLEPKEIADLMVRNLSGELTRS